MPTWHFSPLPLSFKFGTWRKNLRRGFSVLTHSYWFCHTAGSNKVLRLHLYCLGQHRQLEQLNCACPCPSPSLPASIPTASGPSHRHVQRRWCTHHGQWQLVRLVLAPHITPPTPPWSNAMHTSIWHQVKYTQWGWRAGALSCTAVTAVKPQQDMGCHSSCLVGNGACRRKDSATCGYLVVYWGAKKLNVSALLHVLWHMHHAASGCVNMHHVTWCSVTWCQAAEAASSKQT